MPRASWRGFLRLSLVSCPVYLSPATTGTKPIRLHQVWQPVEVKRGRVTGSECRAAGFGIIGTAARRRPYQPCGAGPDRGFRADGGRGTPSSHRALTRGRPRGDQRGGNGSPWDWPAAMATDARFIGTLRGFAALRAPLFPSSRRIGKWMQHFEYFSRGVVHKAVRPARPAARTSHRSLRSASGAKRTNLPRCCQDYSGAGERDG